MVMVQPQHSTVTKNNGPYRNERFLIQPTPSLRHLARCSPFMATWSWECHRPIFLGKLTGQRSSGQSRKSFRRWECVDLQEERPVLHAQVALGEPLLRAAASVLDLVRLDARDAVYRLTVFRAAGGGRGLAVFAGFSAGGFARARAVTSRAISQRMSIGPVI